MSRVVPPVTLTAVALLFGACRPEIDDDASRVEGPRILAVRAEPAEARVNEKVVLTALYTDGSKAVADAPLGWSFCNARKALAEPDPIDPGCLSGSAARALGAGGSVPTTVPRDACRAFGPDRPLGKPGEPAGRPADPDSTGGFFQPGVVGGAGASPALFEVRVRCTLPSVPQQVSLDFEQRYRANANPEIAAVARVSGATVEAVGDDGLRAARGETIRLRVSWPDCVGDAPCGGAERYVSYDPSTRALVDRRESIAVSWLTTSGSFVAPRTGRSETDTTTSVENDWVAAGAGSIFIVVRDARGGVTFRTIPVQIR